jgi:hypothetical protein
VKYFTRGLANLFALCVMLRVGAWLIEPALPVLAMLFFLTGVVSLIVRGRRPW